MVSRYLVDVREAMGLLVAIEWLKEIDGVQASHLLFRFKGSG
jgi:hypothetical protein